MAVKIDTMESAKAVGSNSDFWIMKEMNIPRTPATVPIDPMVVCDSIVVRLSNASDQSIIC